MKSRVATIAAVAALVSFSVFSWGATSAPGSSAFRRWCARVLENFSERREYAELDGKTIRVKKALPGFFGGKYLVIERKWREDWFHTESADDPAPQGSPEWIFDMFGQEVASRLGFTRNSDGTITMPDQKEFIGILQFLIRGHRLGEPLPLVVLPHPEPLIQAPTEKHVDHFVTSGILPWATSGTYFHHDYYFHVLSLLLCPNPIYEHARKQMRTVIDYKKFIVSKYPDLNRESLVQDYFTEYYKELSQRLDVYSASMYQFYTVGNHPPLSDEGVRRAKMLAFRGATPKAFFEEITGSYQVTRSAQTEHNVEVDIKLARARDEFIALSIKSNPTFMEEKPEIGDTSWIRAQVEKKREQLGHSSQRIQEERTKQRQLAKP